MVYYKHTVLALFLALVSSISAKDDVPSLKEIILGIPEGNVRGRIETAYVDGNVDEVERGLFSYLDEYNFEKNEIEDVQKAKEKAWSIISERVAEMRTMVNLEESGGDMGPPAPNNTGGDPGNVSPGHDFIVQLESLTLAEFLSDIETDHSEMANNIHEDMKSHNREKVEDDIFEFIVEKDDVSFDTEELHKLRQVIKYWVDHYISPGHHVNEQESLALEGKSDVVDALNDIAATQKKVLDLINELKGGL